MDFKVAPAGVIGSCKKAATVQLLDRWTLVHPEMDGSNSTQGFSFLQIFLLATKTFLNSNGLMGSCSKAEPLYIQITVNKLMLENSTFVRSAKIRVILCNLTFGRYESFLPFATWKIFITFTILDITQD